MAYQHIEDYGIIGNLRTAALIGKVDRAIRLALKRSLPAETIC